WESIDMLIGPMCVKKGVELEWKSGIPGDRCVYVDPLRLTQIFVNLLSNSVKYTPEGGHIVFECREEKRVGNKVFDIFVVSDNGIGMSEEFQKHLFEPFAQESHDVISDLNGTGLGLSIVKGIVDALDGSIEVESKAGEGSKFTVKLAFEVAEEACRSQKTGEEVDLNGKRILVVEDNDINREIAEAILQKKGIVTETAVNGQEAVEMFASRVAGYYDMILMDIRMPVMSGLTATKRIRAMDRDDAAEIPIVAMTANAFSKDVQASLDAGMDAHLSKPIEPNVLYSTISKFVS
ncbi:MAG: response regulator, partial [Lachnospiraceae bacterium]|nr:response regulator [Lachnospiraceae bacterium]